MRTMLAPTLKNEESAQDVVDEIKKCVHCGICNSVCPTYRLTGNELHGPRGRIYLVKGLLERDDANDTLEDSLGKCLTCRACEPACPSGVQYGKIAEEARFLMHRRPNRQPLLQHLLLRLVPNTTKFRRLYRLGRLIRPLLPFKWQREALTRKLPTRTKLIGKNNGKVVLLQGCVQQALTPEVVEHLAELLKARDIEFRLLSEESCCGSLHLHLGEKETAQKAMLANITHAQLANDDVVLSSASGCGVTLKDYGRYFSQQEDATKFEQAVLDVSEYLANFEFKKAHQATCVAFQSPCTLQHGQRIRGVVESILTRVGYQVLPTRDSDQCCGSAGTYSLIHPEQARALRAKKVSVLHDANPDIIVTANVGCQLFLEPVLDRPILHWIELLG